MVKPPLLVPSEKLTLVELLLKSAQGIRVNILVTIQDYFDSKTKKVLAISTIVVLLIVIILVVVVHFFVPASPTDVVRAAMRIMTQVPGPDSDAAGKRQRVELSKLFLNGYISSQFDFGLYSTYVDGTVTFDSNRATSADEWLIEGKDELAPSADEQGGEFYGTFKFKLVKTSEG